jgi:AcrR family transcriptional regulator
MFGNVMKTSGKKVKPPKKDARVLRTRDRLGDALIALMKEQPFDQITVQQVLDRAEVSRSTFYTHYTGKEDLFLGDVDDFWEYMSTRLARHGEKSNRVAPVRELFAHVADVGEFRAALQASGRVHDVLELGRGHFARAIEKRLTELSQANRSDPGRNAVLAEMFSGALFALLDRWLNASEKETPAQMDDLFHQMVWGALGATAREKNVTTAREMSRSKH